MEKEIEERLNKIEKSLAKLIDAVDFTCFAIDLKNEKLKEAKEILLDG